MFRTEVFGMCMRVLGCGCSSANGSGWVFQKKVKVSHDVFCLTAVVIAERGDIWKLLHLDFWKLEIKFLCGRNYHTFCLTSLTHITYLAGFTLL